jgi:Uma2 family endonuclease
MEARITRRTFDVHEYHRMAEAGILGEDDRIELIEGEIVRMSPIGSRHAACVNRLAKFLERAVGDNRIVSVQNPIRLSDLSEAEPDLALLRFREDFYSGSHPAPGDALLVVEVSETSAAYDREVKLSLYSASGVEEAWVVDLGSPAVEVHSGPQPNGYATKTTARPGESVESATVPGLSLPVDEIIG